MICGSDHTASAWNAKIGVPRQAPKNLRPSDKLTPNPRSGSGSFDFINHLPRTRSRRSRSRPARTFASIAQSGSCGFHGALAASTEAPSFGHSTVNSLRSMVDSRAKKPRQVVGAEVASATGESECDFVLCLHFLP